jgi:hypothetical protein
MSDKRFNTSLSLARVWDRVFFSECFDSWATRGSASWVGSWETRGKILRPRLGGRYVLDFILAYSTPQGSKVGFSLRNNVDLV